jgi:uncharacterized protein (UPF0179 family)
MRRFAKRFIVLLPLLAACDGGLAGGLQDIVWADTAYDLPLLPDAVVIGGDDARSDNGILQDTAWPIDPGAADPGVADLGTPDIAALDLPKPPVDAIEGDAAGDVSPPGDTLEPCGAGGDVCAPGTTCRIDGEGNGQCVPMAVCDDEGTVDIAEVLAMLVLQDSVYVKVAAPVWVGAPSCSLIDCPKDSPCCNACFAQLMVGDIEMPVVLLGRDAMFGCQGSECDFESMCEPLEPGRRYRVWGRVRLAGSRAEFQVDGFCPLDDEADQ